MTGWWRHWRRRVALQSRPIDDRLWALTLARYPFLGRRSAADLGALRNMATLFLAEKEFMGAGGLHVTDEMAVAIAAQACLPVLALGFDWLDGFVGIVVHEDAVLARREIEDADGVVHSYDEELAGEAMHGGPIMLAWRDVDEAGILAIDGYNVVVHEFAHVVDMRAGLTAPMSADHPSEQLSTWSSALHHEYKHFCSAVEQGEEGVLDPYGATAPEEFFAVAAEVFFVAPRGLASERPRLYALLRDVFRQDPATENA